MTWAADAPIAPPHTGQASTPSSHEGVSTMCQGRQPAVQFIAVPILDENPWKLERIDPCDNGPREVGAGALETSHSHKAHRLLRIIHSPAEGIGERAYRLARQVLETVLARLDFQTLLGI